jgi:hypothetical protein
MQDPEKATKVLSTPTGTSIQSHNLIGQRTTGKKSSAVGKGTQRKGHAK